MEIAKRKTLQLRTIVIGINLNILHYVPQALPQIGVANLLPLLAPLVLRLVVIVWIPTLSNHCSRSHNQNPLSIVLSPLSKLPYLSPILQWIPHILRSEYVCLLVANANHASAVEVDVLYFLGAIALVYALLGLSTIDVERLSVGLQFSVDEIIHLN
jgi:hypothetical protein